MKIVVLSQKLESSDEVAEQLKHEGLLSRTGQCSVAASFPFRCNTPEGYTHLTFYQLRDELGVRYAYRMGESLCVDPSNKTLAAMLPHGHMVSGRETTSEIIDLLLEAAMSRQI